jgi:SAM-dependent methyltransferase
MKPSQFHRLHSLRMENDEAGFDMREAAPRFQTIAKKQETGDKIQPLTAWQLFQTPPDVAARLVGLLPITAQSRVLEPSAGLGRILDALDALDTPAAEVVAVEPAANLAACLYNRDGVKLYQRDFLSLTPDTLGMFDAIAMNPPFHMRADINHIKHALTFLRPGGTLAALCMDTRHRAEILRPLASTWKPLPSGTFRSSGTNVGTVLLSIQAPSA